MAQRLADRHNSMPLNAFNDLDLASVRFRCTGTNSGIDPTQFLLDYCELARWCKKRIAEAEGLPRDLQA